MDRKSDLTTLASAVALVLEGLASMLAKLYVRVAYVMGKRL